MSDLVLKMNSYSEERHFDAMNHQNIYVSYTGDYHQSFLHHVHNSCELLFFTEGQATYRFKGQEYEA